MCLEPNIDMNIWPIKRIKNSIYTICSSHCLEIYPKRLCQRVAEFSFVNFFLIQCELTCKVSKKGKQYLAYKDNHKKKKDPWLTIFECRKRLNILFPNEDV